jgi:hypothetical protein
LSYIGKQPTPAPLTSSDITDSIITSAKISDGTVAQADISDQAINEAKLQISNAPTNGYFLSAQSGNTGGMTWAEAGGTHTKIATADYSSAVSSFTLTDCFTSTYPIYKVYLYNLLASSDNVELRAYFLDSGGSGVGTFQQASDGSYIGYTGNSAGVTSQAQDASDYIRFSGEEIQSEANKVSQLELTIYQPYESTHTTVHYNYLLNSSNDHHYQLDGVAYLSSTTSLRSLKFQSSNGDNFSSYKTVIYGIKR